MTVPRHYQKAKEWVVPRLLEWLSHSLAYKITQPINLTTAHITAATLTSALGEGALWSVFLFEFKQIYLLPTAVSLTELFVIRHQEPELH